MPAALGEITTIGLADSISLSSFAKMILGFLAGELLSCTGESKPWRSEELGFKPAVSLYKSIFAFLLTDISLW